MSSTSTALSQLDQLKQFTRVVADTSDFEAMKKFAPEDATTNPSLILKAAGMPAYAGLMDKAVADARTSDAIGDRIVHQVFENLLILFGLEILKIVPGRVSTETDAAYSFDVDALVNQGQHFIRLYEKAGIPRERILIKIASTWEGVKAAEILQQSNINCNMTLLFSLGQAVACAQVGAKLISPFVGRILDWHKKNSGKDFAPADDPGVQSVQAIYHYYKKFDHPTEVMGASFRNKGEIVELAGCDLLTISPELLGELAASNDPLPRKLDPERAKAADIDQFSVDEKAFRWMLNEDAMATEKTAEGIRRFHADALELHNLIRNKL